MPLTLTKTQIQMQIRQLVLQATALEFIATAGEKMDICFFTENMDKIIEHQMINRFEIVVNERGKPIAGCDFLIDWGRNQSLCHIEGDIPIDELAEGDIYLSSREILQVFKRYIDAVYKRCSDPVIDIWWTPNQAVKNRMGAGAFNAALGIEHCPDKAAQHAKEYAAIRALKDANARKGRRKNLDFIHTPEANGGVW